VNKYYQARSRDEQKIFFIMIAVDTEGPRHPPICLFEKLFESPLFAKK
jgi:hypothetical protein